MVENDSWYLVHADCLTYPLKDRPCSTRSSMMVCRDVISSFQFIIIGVLILLLTVRYISTSIFLCFGTSDPRIGTKYPTLAYTIDVKNRNTFRA